jgi:hypothetical protein
LAFNYGGKPVFVMPLIFGFAPVINTLVSMGLAGKLSQITTIFAGSLGLVIGGAVMVLVNAPKPKHGPAKAADKPTPTPSTPSTPSTPTAPPVTVPTEPAEQPTQPQA